MAEYPLILRAVPDREALIQEAACAMAVLDLKLNEHQEPLSFYEGLAETAANVFLR